MTAQTTPAQRQAVKEFLKPFMKGEELGTPEAYFHSKISDGDAADRLNATYLGSSWHGVFTTSKVRRVRLETWGTSKAPKAAKPASPVPETKAFIDDNLANTARPPVPDAVGCFWERLDHQAAALVEIERKLDLLAALATERDKKLGTVLADFAFTQSMIEKIVVKLAKVWNVS